MVCNAELHGIISRGYGCAEKNLCVCVYGKVIKLSLFNNWYNIFGFK